MDHWLVEATRVREQAIERKIEAPAEDSRVQTVTKMHPKSVRKLPKIDPKSTSKRSSEHPGSHRGPPGPSRAPKSAPRSARSGARRGPEGALGPHRGAQGAIRWGLKSAQGGSKRLRKGVLEAQNRARGAREGKKSEFRQKCSATRPCRCARHFGPPQNDPKSVPNRSKALPGTP